MARLCTIFGVVSTLKLAKVQIHTDGCPIIDEDTETIFAPRLGKKLMKRDGKVGSNTDLDHAAVAPPAQPDPGRTKWILVRRAA